MTPNGNRDIQKEMNHTRKNKNIKINKILKVIKMFFALKYMWLKHDNNGMKGRK